MEIGWLLPLLCVSATGSVGDATSHPGQPHIKKWVYYVIHGKPYRRAYVVPYDERTPARDVLRTKFENGMTYWKNQTEEYREGYRQEALGKDLKMHGVNLFLRRWMKDLI